MAMTLCLNPGIRLWSSAPMRLVARAFGAGAIAVVVGAACAGQTYSSVPPPEGYHPEKDTAITAVNKRPDANRQMQMHRAHLQLQRFAAANLERRRQLTEDSARLLQLAVALNTELQMSGEAGLSLTAKADMIEKLAHAVQEKMKLTVGP